MKRVSFPPSTLAVTLTLLLNAPMAAALKVAFTKPVLAGAMGWFVYLVTVQPQDPLTLLITNGVLPSFVNVKSMVTGFPCVILPKLCVVNSHLNFAIDVGDWPSIAVDCPSKLHLRY